MRKSRETKKLVTRRKLIEAASAEFAETGYARANISRISQRAGLGKGTVYNYFRSKHELLVGVVEHAMELLIEEIRREIADLDDPIEKMQCALRVDYRFMEKNEALSKVMVREGFSADPEKQREFLSALAPFSVFFMELLEEGKARGRLRSDLDSGWATVMVEGMGAYMLLTRWALDDASLSYDQMADLTINCFIDGIRAR